MHLQTLLPKFGESSTYVSFTKLWHQSLVGIPCWNFSFRIPPKNHSTKVWCWNLVGIPSSTNLIFTSHKDTAWITLCVYKSPQKRKWILWLWASQAICQCHMSSTWHSLSHPRIRMLKTILTLSLCFLTNSCLKMELCHFSTPMIYMSWRRSSPSWKVLFFEDLNEVDCDK